VSEGRKRADIRFTNMATSGFFHWIKQFGSCAHIFIECKNYSSDISNPELDQLLGRLSPKTAFFGIIVCRTLEDRPLLVKRCRDAWGRNQGLIVVLDDVDLGAVVKARTANPEGLDYMCLHDRVSEVIT